jgi:HEAT repeat protein
MSIQPSEDSMMRAVKYLAVIGCMLWLANRAPAQDDAAALAGQLDSPDVKVRVDACQALAKLGIKAQVAVPPLIKALQADDAELQRAAALALAELGEGAVAAVPALAENLKAEDPQVRSYSAHALGEIGPAARGATEALIAALADKDETVRREVRDALREIKPGKEVAVPLFAKMLTNASPADAAAAVQTLAEAGEAAVPALIAALDNKEAAYWACLALAEIGPKAAPAVEKLGSQLDSDEAETRMQALAALAAIGPASKPLVGKISALLSKDDMSGVRYAAAYALGMIGDRAAAAQPLAQAMDDKDEFLRVTAAWAYVRLVEDEKSPAIQKAVKIVVDGAASQDHRVRDVAMRAFGDPDLPVEQLRPAFRKVLQGIRDPEQLMEIVDALASLGPKVVPGCIRSLEEKAPLRFYAVQMLIKIGPDAAPAVPALTASLADPQPELRRETLFALGAIGPAAAPAADKIAARLSDDDQEVRHAACYALGKIGPTAQVALPNLRGAMDSDDEFMQLAAVWAALKISPQDEELQKSAVPHLIKGLKDVRIHVRLEAAGLLGELGHVAQSAIPALQEVQQDENDDVRAAATKSLELLQK